MKARRTMSVLLSVLLASACASSGPPPAPGPAGARPINDPAAIEAIGRAASAARLASEYDEAQRERRARLFEVPPEHEGRRWFRDPEPASLARLPARGAAPRTVSVPFDFGSTRFRPSADQALALRELMVLAERIEVRGRTDGQGDAAGDRAVARARAEAAKAYLVHRGVPASLISVSYVAGGDPVGDNRWREGRARNRRVDVEFVLPARYAYEPEAGETRGSPTEGKEQR